MTYQRNPDERPDAVRRRMNITREDGSWGVFPAVLGVVFLLLVGLIAYNMYNGRNGPNSVNPSAQAPVTTPAPSTTTPPATTPPPATTTPPAKTP